MQGAIISQMKTILVGSLKGGVGKTTISAGLALALSRRGFNVGAIDLDYHAPNLHILLNCNQKPTRGKGSSVIPPVANGIKVISWAMIWPPESAVTVEDSQVDAEDMRHVINILRASVVSRSNGNAVLLERGLDSAVKYLNSLIDHPGGAIEHVSLLLRPGEIDWGEIDYLVVDSPPEMTGVVRVIAEHGVYGAVIVCHPSSVSLADVARTIDLFRKRQVPVFGVVSNQGSVNGERRFDLEDKDVMQFSVARGVPFILSIPHTQDLNPYFDTLVESVLTLSPVTLPKQEVDMSGVEAMLKKAKKLADILEAFKS